MMGKSKPQTQRDLFRPLLSDFIDMRHELVLLAEKIDWKYFEQEFSVLYSHTGQPSMPVRLMVSSLMLKHLYNLGDESLCEAWKMNPYMQYFSGEAYFQHRFPCDPSDFVHFRKRIGVEGVEKIFACTVELHGKDAREQEQLSDTTVQENNITFPTDAKLAKKIIDNCNKIAREHGVEQRQSYVRVSKDLLRDSYNAKHPKRSKRAKKATKKLKTIAGRLIRELERKLPESERLSYEEALTLYKRILSQKQKDKDKIYSLHKPFTACISKGKAHKPYEFGNKIGVMLSKKSLIITAIKAFKGNPHDSTTIGPLLEQFRKNLGFSPKEVIYDRGGRGKKAIGKTKISTPGRGLKGDSEYEKRKKRKKFRRRAAIEPVIGHLKMSFRMQKNYLSGEDSAEMNAFMAAAGWNLKKMMKKLKEEIFWLYFFLRRKPENGLFYFLNALKISS